jgi:hypothetical protein
MSVKHLAIVLASVVLACVSASAALAQEDQVVAPPGNSGVEEYLEVVPGSGGDRAAGGRGQADSLPSDAAPGQAEPHAVLGEDAVRALRRLGADGRAAAHLAMASAPPMTSDSKGDDKASKQAKKRSGSGRSRPAATDGSGGRAEAVAGALAGNGGGMGLAFPLVLLGAMVAALVLAVRRIARNE